MKIRAVNLTKTYFKGSPHEVSAVKNASIDIAERDFCLLTGPSGSGKTTLLCLLGLLTKPTQGKVFIDDEEVSSLLRCLANKNPKKQNRLHLPTI